MTLKAAELIPIVSTPAKMERARSAYLGLLKAAGRSFTPLATVWNKSSYDFNSGGEFNQIDHLLRWQLAWLFFKDAKARESSWNFARHLAKNLDDEQNGHGQSFPGLAMIALDTPSPADRKLLIDAYILYYGRKLNDKEWKSVGPTTFRPGTRFMGCCARLSHDMALMQEAGLVHPNQFPTKGPAWLGEAIQMWVDSWFGMVRSTGTKGWIVKPGAYAAKKDERRWLYWSAKTSASEETNVTWFMHGHVFPRECMVAALWLKKPMAWFPKLLKDRGRDMATWALAVGFDPVSGLARRAQDWSPDILTAKGPFHTYASATTGERTHSLGAAILGCRLPKEERKALLVDVMAKGMKIPAGDVVEDLVIAAMELGFGASS